MRGSRYSREISTDKESNPVLLARHCKVALAVCDEEDGLARLGKLEFEINRTHFKVKEGRSMVGLDKQRLLVCHLNLVGVLDGQLALSIIYVFL